MFNGILFQESLQDLVKGIRAHRRDEPAYVREKIAEIAKECRSSDIAKKSTAVLKLTHLQMMGYNASFAAFHIVEVMSCPSFASKRIGYLAAAQSFSPTTDVLLLTTNQFKKDLTNGKMQDCSQALTCLAKLVNESLACDLGPDVALLLSSPRPYIRKKTLLVLYRLIMVYPDTLHAVSSKFINCLSDPDPGVVCAAVTVTCELARASPRAFLELAPVLYQLLTTSNNNWMLIKIVKLMGVLTPLEPRLAKKLVAPLTDLMRNTRAKSLLYECCSTVTEGLLDYPELVKLCGDRLGEFMVDPDQNLKYLGLLSMRKLATAHPQIAVQHRDLILDCLDDVDIGIRMRALELVFEFVTRRTVRDISRILLRKLRDSIRTLHGIPAGSGLFQTSDGVGSTGLYADITSLANPAGGTQSSGFFLDPEIPYREALGEQLLAPGRYVRGEGYPLLASSDDFTWYIATVLGGLARTPGLSPKIAQTVASQLTELITRVEAVRPATVAVAVAILKKSVPSTRTRDQAVEMLPRNVPDQALLPGFEEQTPSLLPGFEEQTQALLPSFEEQNSEVSPINGAGHDVLQLPNPDVDGAVSIAVSSEKLTSTEAITKPVESFQNLPSEVVSSAAWAIGEYADLLINALDAAYVIMDYPTKRLDGPAQVALVTACVKVFAACKPEEGRILYPDLMTRFERGISSDVAEVYERSLLFGRLLELTGPSSNVELRPLFEDKLLPVDYRAQKQVLVPEGLDLDISLLDARGMSLQAYLAEGEESYVTDQLGMDVAEQDDDDIFKQLQGNSSLLGSISSNAPGHAGNPGSKSRRTDSVFYLGQQEPKLNDVRDREGVTGLLDDLIDARSNIVLSSDSLSREEVGAASLPVAVLTGELLPNGVNVSKKEVVETSRNRSSGNPSHARNERLDAALDGAFGLRQNNHGPGKSKRRRKKRSQSNDEAMEKNVNLIDFEDSTATSKLSSVHQSEEAVPKHIASQTDLLL